MHRDQNGSRMPLRLRHIEVLQAIHRTGSITGAANMLNVSQPAVSKMLRHAEEQLGLRLFDRVKGKLIPTAESKLLETEIERAFASLERIVDVAANLQSGNRGHIRLACPPSLGLGYVTDRLAAFHQQYPGIAFDLATYHTHELLELLSTNQLDLAITYDPQNEAGIRKIQVGQAKLVHLSAVALAEKEAATIRLRDIDQSTLIGLDIDSPIGMALAGAFSKAGIGHGPRNLIRTYYLALPLVRYGAGSAIVDEYTANAWNSPDVVARVITPEIKLSITALHHERYPLSHSASLFIDYLIGKPRRDRSGRGRSKRPA